MWYSIRNSYYADKYLQTLLNRYRHNLRIIPVTYYKFDTQNSTYDNNLLKSGNWEPFGTYTGMHWIKIHYIPLSFIQEMTKYTNANEYGVYGMNETNAVLSYINFRPRELDFIHFKFNNNEDEVIYQVKHVELLYKNESDDLNIYRINLIATGYKPQDIENHLSNIYYYDEITKNIYDLNTYEKILESYTYIKNTLSTLNRTNNLGMRSINVR